MTALLAAPPHAHLTEAEIGALQRGVARKTGRLLDHLSSCEGCLDRFERGDPLRELALRDLPRLSVLGPPAAALGGDPKRGAPPTRAGRYRLGRAALGRIGAVAAVVAIVALGTGPLRDGAGRPATVGASAQLAQLNGALLTAARAHDPRLTRVLSSLRDAAMSVDGVHPDARTVEQLKAARALIVQLPGAEGLDALGAIDGALQREGSDPTAAAVPGGPVLFPDPNLTPDEGAPATPPPVDAAPAAPPPADAPPASTDAPPALSGPDARPPGGSPAEPASPPSPSDAPPAPGPPAADPSRAPEDPPPVEPAAANEPMNPAPPTP